MTIKTVRALAYVRGKYGVPLSGWCSFSVPSVEVLVSGEPSLEWSGIANEGGHVLSVEARMARLTTRARVNDRCYEQRGWRRGLC